MPLKINVSFFFDYLSTSEDVEKTYMHPTNTNNSGLVVAFQYLVFKGPICNCLPWWVARIYSRRLAFLCFLPKILNKTNFFFCLIKLNGIWAGKLTYIYIGRISNFQSLVLHIGPITYNVYHRLTLLMLNSV